MLLIILIDLLHFPIAVTRINKGLVTLMWLAPLSSVILVLDVAELCFDKKSSLAYKKELTYLVFGYFSVNI